MELPAPVTAFMADFPAAPSGLLLLGDIRVKINGTQLRGAEEVLGAWDQLHAGLRGPVRLLGALDRDGDLAVTWQTPAGVQGATRFTLDGDRIAAIATRWTGLTR